MVWKELISSFFSSDAGEKIKKFIIEERKTKIILPEPTKVFSSFNEDLLKYEDIKIVILQDNFNCNKNAQEIFFKELKRNLYGYLKQETFDKYFASTDLTSWIKQGIFMYNIIPTGVKEETYSHKDKGWEPFSELVVKKLNNHPESIVFILLGESSLEYESLITDSKHLVLTVEDLNDFVGSGFFEKAVDYIQEKRPSCIFKIHPNFESMITQKDLSDRLANMFKQNVPAMTTKLNKKNIDETARILLEWFEKEAYSEISFEQIIDFKTSKIN